MLFNIVSSARLIILTSLVSAQLGLKKNNEPISICRPYVKGEMFNMLSSVASEAPTLSPIFINLTSFYIENK